MAVTRLGRLSGACVLLVCSACGSSDDGPRTAASPTASASTTIAPTTTATTPLSHGCGFTPVELERWFGWTWTEHENRRGRGQCAFRTDEGTELTVLIGPAEWFPDAIANVQASPTYLNRFDPTRDHHFMETIGPGPVTLVGADSGNIIIIDVAVEPEVWPDVLPAALTRFALDRLNPRDIEGRTDRLVTLQTGAVQCGSGFGAFNEAATVGLGISIPAADIDRDHDDSGSFDVSTSQQVGAFFGENLTANRCTDTAVDEGPIFEARWPVVAGTVMWSIDRVPVDVASCGMRASVTATGLIVERPDGESVLLADITIENWSYANNGIDGCDSISGVPPR